MEDRLSRLQKYSSSIMFSSEIILGVVLNIIGVYKGLGLKIDVGIIIFSMSSAFFALIAFVIALDFKRKYAGKNLKEDSEFDFYVYGQFFTILFAVLSIFILIFYALLES